MSQREEDGQLAGREQSKAADHMWDKDERAVDMGKGIGSDTDIGIGRGVGVGIGIGIGIGIGGIGYWVGVESSGASEDASGALSSPLRGMGSVANGG